MYTVSIYDAERSHLRRGDLKKVAKEAEELKRFSGKRMILFVDELHRFNKAQQDCLLPFVESGWLH